MRIRYLKQSGNHFHPLSKRDVHKVFRVVPEKYAAMIKEVQFTCNRGSGTFYEIYKDYHRWILKIEVCLHDDRLYFIDQPRHELDIIKKVGGHYDGSTKDAVFPDGSGKKYAAFIILFALSMFMYSDATEGPHLGVRSGDKKKWCDKHALELLDTINFEDEDSMP